MKFFNLTLISSLGLSLAISSCNNEHDEHGHLYDKEPSKEQETPSNRIDIPLSVRNNLGITFTKVETRVVENTVRIPGAFELEPLARKEYHMVMPGDVEFLVSQYASVKVGTPLYRVRSLRFVELKQEVQAVESRLRTAKARKEKLTKANIKRADLDEQIANLESDLTKVKAQLNTAEEAFGRTVSGNWVEVVSKQKGIIESLSLTNGAYAQAGELILSVVDPSMVRFRAVGMQADALHWENGQAARISPPQSDTSNINDSIAAELRMGVIANPTNRTIDVLGLPKQTEESSDLTYAWARPGVTGFLEVAQESTEDVVLAIPASAIVKDGITHVFFKRDPENPDKVIRVEADMGVNDGRWVEIMSELGPKDEVVLNGAYELKLASAQSGTTQKGGHFHADGTFHGEDH